MRIKWKKLNMKLNVIAMINFQTRGKYAYNVSNYSTYPEIMVGELQNQNDMWDCISWTNRK